MKPSRKKMFDMNALDWCLCPKMITKIRFHIVTVLGDSNIPATNGKHNAAGTAVVQKSKGHALKNAHRSA